MTYSIFKPRPRFKDYFQADGKTIKDIPENTVTGQQLLDLFTNLFQKYGIRLYITFGTALALYRDQKLFDYDHDLDLAIFENEIPQIVDLVAELRKNGCFLEEVTHDRLIFRHPQSRWATDLWALQTDTSLFYRLQGKIIKTADGFYKKEYFTQKGAQTISVQGKTYYIPNMIENYFIEHYGTDWRVPKKDFNAYYRPFISQLIHRVFVDSEMPLKFSGKNDLCVWKPWASKLLRTVCPKAKITSKFRHPI